MGYLPVAEHGHQVLPSRALGRVLPRKPCEDIHTYSKQYRSWNLSWRVASGGAVQKRPLRTVKVDDDGARVRWDADGEV